MKAEFPLRRTGKKGVNLGIKDGSIWRDLLGPELSEQLIAQAWDDIANGRHREEMWQSWEIVPIAQRRREICGR